MSSSEKPTHYMGLMCDLILDIADRLGVRRSCIKKDLYVVQQRCRHEGISFLTKTLPSLGKAIDFALQGKNPLSTPGFATRGALPLFMRWALQLVFTESGLIAEKPNVEAIRCLRQMCYLCYKLDLPFSPTLVEEVLVRFKQTDESLPPVTRCSITKRASSLACRVFRNESLVNIVPGHGPGAVATGEDIVAKGTFSRWSTTLQERYPVDEYKYLSLDHFSDSPPLWHPHGVAKVVLVPKDSRGPRLISCEPIYNQWIQQGQMRKLVNIIEYAPLTCGHVNFRDQSKNRRLALKASRDQTLVTLDMKDASDRVSLELVREVFGGTSMLDALLASRSIATKLPDGSVVTLRKFAPMGSAVCFPVEAFIFWALSVSCISLTQGCSSFAASRRVWVYGDDLILYREDYAIVMQHLERFGLRFNERKCCTGGFFRESCGCDAYKGVDVTPTRLRARWDLPNSANQLAHYCSFGSEMFRKGFSRTYSSVRAMVEARYGPLPSGKDAYEWNEIVPPSYDPRREVRYNKAYQRWEYKGWVPKSVYRKVPDSMGELLRTLVRGSIRLTNGTVGTTSDRGLKRSWKPLNGPHY